MDTSTGYGQFFPTHRRWLAHRLVWHLTGVSLPDSLHHNCGVKLCVNPDHLQPVTRSEHTAIHAELAHRTHCKYGHEYTEANTYWRPDGRGRQCRRCSADKMTAKYAALSAEERRALITYVSERRRERKARIG